MSCPFTPSHEVENTTVLVESIDNRNDVKSALNGYLPEKKIKKNQEYLETPQLAFAMKEGTKVVHKAAENSIFTKRFLSGDISKDEYGRYINSLYFVYKTMEDLLEKHKDNSTVNSIYFPVELNRAKFLIRDLEYYYGKDRVAELTNFENATPAVKNYISALHDAASRNPALLIAHSYSRYLGDLSGGQILAKRLKKFVLKLDVTDAAWDSYQGLEFYNFENIGSHNEFKNLYRQRLDEAQVTQYVKDSIVAEAIYSFELNIALFDEIQTLSQANELKRTLDSSEAFYSPTPKPKKITPSADWLVGFATGAITVALGFSMYRRVLASETF